MWSIYEPRRCPVGFYVLHDDDADRAVLYDSTSERPIDTPGFIGGNARELAESFLAYLATEHNAERVEPSVVANPYLRPDDPRTYHGAQLESARDHWYELATTGETDELNAYGLDLYQWFLGSRIEPAPEPPLLRAVDQGGAE